jgi:hypothetical protein
MPAKKDRVSPLTAKVRIVVAALFWVAFLAPAWGETTDATSPPTTAGPIITETVTPIAAGQFAVQPFWGVSLAQGKFSPGWRPTTAGGDFTSFVTLLHLVYGLAENVEVYADFPAIQNWAGQVNPPAAGNRAADFGGLGDITLAGKYQLCSETERRPTVTPFFSVTFPTGHASGLNPGRLGTDDLGSGAFTFQGGLLLGKWLPPVYLTANLLYTLPTQAPPKVSHSQFGPLLPPVINRGQATFNLAAEWVLNPRWVVLLEYYSTWEVGPLIGKRTGAPAALLGVLPGLEFVLSPRWNIEAGVAIDVAGKNSTYNLTPIVSTAFTF